MKTKTCGLAATAAALAIALPAQATAIFTVVGGDTLLGYDVQAAGGSATPGTRIRLSGGAGHGPLNLTNLFVAGTDFAAVNDGALLIWRPSDFHGGALDPFLTVPLTQNGTPIGAVNGLAVVAGGLDLVFVQTGDQILAFDGETILTGGSQEAGIAITLQQPDGGAVSDVTGISIANGSLLSVVTGGGKFLLFGGEQTDTIFQASNVFQLNGLAGQPSPTFNGLFLNDSGVLAFADGHTVLAYGPNFGAGGGSVDPEFAIELVDDTGAAIKGATISFGNDLGGFPPLSPGAVPEPTTWALTILGFGLAGATMRRRRATALVF